MPPPPDWPKDHPAARATVVFNSRGLLIVASNSSLDQILNEVAMDTGAIVEGIGTDQRIFGSYGPGPARDVITQLLDGSGYDVLMIGDRGQGTPRRIVLTAQSGSSVAQNSANRPPSSPTIEDTEADQPAPEPEAEEPPPSPAPAASGSPVPVRSPQQMLEEMQQQRPQQPNAPQNPQN